MSTHFDELWNHKREPRPIPVNPNLAAADSLGVWFEERFSKLQPAARERIYALMVLLQRRYFFQRRKATEPQWEPLHTAYECAYERLEELLEDTDMPLPEWREAAAKPATESPEQADDAVYLHMDKA